MANWNRWGIAAGLAGALAFCGTAWAQSPGTPNNTSGSTPGTTESDTGSHGTRSGWSGSSATEPSDHRATDTTQGSSSSSAKGSYGSTASSSSSGKVDKKLEEDIQKIHAANQAEIHMGKMAQQQASSDEVKQFGQKLEQDHQSVDDKLTQAAQSAGITLEGKGSQAEQKDAQKMMDKLQGKTGPEFDKAFASMMVKDHEKDIKETQKAAKEAKKQNQTELASVLDQAVTGMKGHLEMAKQLEKTAGKGKSASGTPGSSTGSGSSGSGSTGSSSPTGSSHSWKNDSGSTSGASGSSGSSSDTTGTSGSKTDATKSTNPSTGQ